jgi:hypothetical protein
MTTTKIMPCLDMKEGRVAQRWGAKPMKRNPFPRRPMTHNFKRPHSKAEEPDCLFRRNPLSNMITTQSPY